MLIHTPFKLKGCRRLFLSPFRENQSHVARNVYTEEVKFLRDWNGVQFINTTRRFQEQSNPIVQQPQLGLTNTDSLYLDSSFSTSTTQCFSNIQPASKIQNETPQCPKLGEIPLFTSSPKTNSSITRISSISSTSGHATSATKVSLVIP